MNKTLYAVIIAAALVLAGCGNSPETPSAQASPTAPRTAYDLGSIEKGEQALCVVCVTNEGTGAEEAVAETLDYKGKTYAFCKEAEKAEFISSPEKYASQ